jgi:hypothetical protein
MVYCIVFQYTTNKLVFHLKVSVDVLDQMACKYRVQGSTRRWPVAVSYNIFELAGINGCSISRIRGQSRSGGSSKCAGTANRTKLVTLARK